MENEFDSFEQAVEHMTRQIRDQRHRLIDDFYKAYAAQLCHLENFCLDNICLIEQEPHFRDGCATWRYWFEYKPKFDEYVKRGKMILTEKQKIMLYTLLLDSLHQNDDFFGMSQEFRRDLANEIINQQNSVVEEGVICSPCSEKK